jgi:hypothetical protein
MLWHTDGVQLIHQNGSLTILGTSPGQTASMHIKAADLRKLAKQLQILADQLTKSTK